MTAPPTPAAGLSILRDVRWKRSSLCGAGNCVEVAHSQGSYLVRDTKIGGEQHLIFDADEWRAFVAGVKAGEFDA